MPWAEAPGVRREYGLSSSVATPFQSPPVFLSWVATIEISLFDTYKCASTWEQFSAAATLLSCRATVTLSSVNLGG